MGNKASNKVSKKVSKLFRDNEQSVLLSERKYFYFLVFARHVVPTFAAYVYRNCEFLEVYNMWECCLEANRRINVSGVDFFDVSVTWV
jgi:hypothetical protein